MNNKKPKMFALVLCLAAVSAQAFPTPGSCRIGARTFRHGVNNQNAVDEFNRASGRGLGIYMHYTSFSGRWSASQAELARANNSIFHMKFVPENHRYLPQHEIYTRIKNGEADNQFEYIADQMSNWLKQPGTKNIWFDFAHEMNSSWKPYGITLNDANGNETPNGPNRFKGAWRRMHKVIRDRLAANGVNKYRVKFVFAPSRNIWNTPELKVSDYYPGNRYVDYVGCSSYNEPSRSKNLGKLIYNISSQLNNASGGSKYFGLSEVGCNRAQGNNNFRAQWLLDNFRATYFKNLGINFFNYYDAQVNGNYHLSDQKSRNAFRQRMSNRFFIN